jgi:hypothetical protein
LRDLIGGYYAVVYNDKRAYGRRLKFYVVPKLPSPDTLVKIQKEAERLYSCPCKVEVGTRNSRHTVVIKIYSVK